MHPKINNQSRKSAHKPINVFRSMKLLGLTVFRDISVFLHFHSTQLFTCNKRKFHLSKKTQRINVFELNGLPLKDLVYEILELN